MRVKAFNSSQLSVVLLLIILLSGFLAARSFNLKDDEKNIFLKRPSSVYEIRGKVKDPGFYSFDDAQTLKQLINTCGSSVDGIESFKLNKTLKSGTRIVLTDKIKIENLDASARINFFLPIDINTATIEDFTLIPGVGEKTAQSIVSFREKNKGITDLQDLIKIRGIGEKKLNRILPYVSIDS
jgi:competence protein ComEA